MLGPAVSLNSIAVFGANMLIPAGAITNPDTGVTITNPDNAAFITNPDA